MLLRNTDFIDLPVLRQRQGQRCISSREDMLLMIVTDRISAFDVVLTS